MFTESMTTVVKLTTNGINKYDFIENVDYLINKIIVQVPYQSEGRKSKCKFR